MSGERISIVGIGLRYPDANSPDEFWENILAGRRAFRQLPDQRMNRADYFSPDPAAPDRFYAQKAAVLRDFAFDRLRYRVAGSTFRSTDMTHWLALDTAARALADAGFPDGDGLPRRATGVVVGNSLTGEFSRANLMRLRWPYVRRTVASALTERGWTGEETGAFLAELEVRYKQPFPEIDEDTLAGGLANTIAGRICNHFDLAGGGYTVDGACSSSLLSVITAANALSERDLDVAIAGGVDLSIDPFEVIGFAKTGALATGEMKIYDRDSNGFWPGEGSGMVVLMREADARERGIRAYATITGWGVSSDGKGGITRPEAAGHQLALERAYRRAGYGVQTVSYFEGHGTGTALGDATEITGLSNARREADPTARPAALGSVKGNIGHTKAAAGVAGLIKAALAVHHQVIPPITGHDNPHPLLRGGSDASNTSSTSDTSGDPALYVPASAQPWPSDLRMRAGVSAMGFGGVNSHVAIEQPADIQRRTAIDERTTELVNGRQDAELLLIEAETRAELRERVAQLTVLAPRLAMAELTDLAGTLAGQRRGGAVRAAIVATNPDDAARKFDRLLTALDAGATEVLNVGEGVFLASRPTAPRIGLLFPGQGSGRGSGRDRVPALRRRFSAADDAYRLAGLPDGEAGGDSVATEIAQPRIVTGSLAALRVLRELGIEADTAAGHSLGELTALHWGGVMDERQVLGLARIRGAVMATASRGGGAMAGLAADPGRAEELMCDEDVVIAGYNAPRQTVISGPEDAVERVCAHARAGGVTATRIRVSHAFHSPAVEPAAAALAERLGEIPFTRLSRAVVSTVTGDLLHATKNIHELLRDQIVLPVRFREAAAQLAERSDLVLEVGPGRVLAGLFEQIAPGVPVLSVDSDSTSLSGLLRAVGAAYTLGATIDTAALFAGRVVRPLPLDGTMTFLSSPCEAAPAIDADLAVGAGAARAVGADAVAGSTTRSATATGTPGTPPSPGTPVVAGGGDTTLDLLRRFAAERVEMPLDMVTADTHPLDDLHLSSITVGQIVNDVTKALGRPPLEGMPNFATVCLGELAEMIDELGQTSRPTDQHAAGEVAGVEPWVRPFVVEYVEAPRPRADVGAGGAGVNDWAVYAPAGHPLAEPLRVALAGAGLGDGVLLCLPADCDESHVGLFLDAGRAAMAAANGTRFVVVQHGLGAAGFARTLHLEDPATRTTIVDLAHLASRPGLADPRVLASAVDAVVTEVAATTGFAEARYDAAGTRSVPMLRAAPGPRSTQDPHSTQDPRSAPAEDARAASLGPDDVLLVTGGGKGITAESALALAKRFGSRLGLLGRGDPDTDPALAENLARMTAAGVRYRYERADVTRADQVRAAVERIRAELGQVTAILHGAGRNEPAALFSLTEEAFRATLAPKITGLRAVLDAVDEDGLRLLVTFGSIIGRAGLRGEAHYATANDWMTELTRRFQRDHPRCRALALEWSVWSGAGMGERLGVVSALMRDGITPIPTERGIALLERMIDQPPARRETADPVASSTYVVCGRVAGLATLPMERAELPLARFVDRVLVHYPGIELITEADLSLGGDPYLADHLLDGDMLFPAVLGMEAMTQVAVAVTGLAAPPLLENVEFLRPIVVAPGGSTVLRIAALVRDGGTVDVVLRSSDTGFGADHFRARLRFPRPDLPALPGGPTRAAASLPAVPVDPITELYGGVLFQGKRFQRLTGYRRVSARHAVAEVATAANVSWFAPFLPQERVLADPGTRDTMMHAIQCCVPDATLLPQRIDRLHLADRAARDADYLVLDARERTRDGDSYTYDLDVRDPSGRLVERWEGLTLRAVRKRDGAGPWTPTMLGPYLERALERVLGGTRAVVVEPDPRDGQALDTGRRREQTALAVSRAVNRPVRLRYRPDGRPELARSEVAGAALAGTAAPGTVLAGTAATGVDLADLAVSASHGAGLTLAVVGATAHTCDVEDVVERTPDDWAGLLGPELIVVRDLLARETGEPVAVAATRLWGALECVRKTGAMTQAIAVDHPAGDGWVVLSAGRARIATWATTIKDRPGPVVFAVSQQEED